MSAKDFVLYETASGRVLFPGSSYAPESLARPGQSVLPGVKTDTPGQVYVEAGKLVAIPPAPDAFHVWDAQGRMWRPSEALIRQERNQRIAGSDWTQLPDVPEATRLRWQAYRQALRDLPAQPGFPEARVWPQALEPAP